MTIRKTVGTVGTLAQGAVSTASRGRHPIGTASTAVGLAKHPIGTASMAVGFAKGVAGAGLDLVRGGRTDVQEDAGDASRRAAGPRDHRRRRSRSRTTRATTCPVRTSPQFEPPLPRTCPSRS